MDYGGVKMKIPKKLEEKRDLLAAAHAKEYEEEYAPSVMVLAQENEYKEAFNAACNLLLPEIQKLVELLQDSLEVRNFEAPEDAEIKALGERIGFGALLSAAVKGWHKSAKENGYPPEGSFTVGHCHGTVESALQSLREFLNEEEK